ncbi:tyrosine-protein phosphatase [Bacillus dakarensis]|uniref:tyrosine-protein phosphatase n=1 Tax=Robertmurraya dakarensis TaxID=1926278 RepID=UPI0009FC393A|nr:CpsB/CapC family capsule biosynthesis tyrosine phosphatase [Bacillus dakarensis]
MIVDIHNHILPGLDDGPKNWDEMILLARQAVDTGIDHVIATPHHKHQHKKHFYENSPSNILKLVEEANELLKEQNVPLEVHPGIEFHLHEQILEDIEERFEDFLTLNNTGKYMLIEPPCHHLPEQTEEALSRLQKKGFTPIIAHPERNRIIRKNPGLIYKWVKNGILVQVTAGSITGMHGKRLKNFSRHLLDHELVHFIASDAHHHIRRKFELQSCYDFLDRQYSSDYRQYLQTNASNTLTGTDIKINQPKYIEKRRQYFFLYNHPLNRIKEQNL